jgi:signal transduction histidine kinase
MWILMPQTILLVDDEPQILRSLSRVLEENNYELLTASSGVEALEVLKNKAVQVIISDQRMPNMTGSEFLAQVKKTYPKTIRILLSGYADFEAVKEAINEGNIYKYLTKPWQNDTLLNIVEEAFQTYENQSEELIKKKSELEMKRLQDEFLANMSHEIRTPLNGIIGFAEVLESGIFDPASKEHNECLKDILTSSKKLSELVSNILDLAQNSIKKNESNPEKIDIKKLIDEVVESFKEDIENKKIKILEKKVAELDYLTGRPDQIKKIVHHFLSNAIKFSKPNGKVTIQTSLYENDFLKIEVSDEGIGISKEQIANLFTPFKQLEAVMQKKYQGAGLGLALVKQITENLGGKVGVESVFGQGSSFYAIVPINSHLEKGL